MAHLYLSNVRSDVTFLIEGEKLPAHRIILETSSDYFRALLAGGFAESQQSEIEFNDTPINAFKAVLKLIYTGRVPLDQLSQQDILDTLDLAHRYGLTYMAKKIETRMKKCLTLDNCCVFLEKTKLYEMNSLLSDCESFLDRNAATFLTHKSFNTLSQSSLCELLKRDSFAVPEKEIFKAVVKWWEHNNDKSDIKQILSQVRFSLMSVEYLAREVHSTGIVDSDLLMSAIAIKFNGSQLPFRKGPLEEVNVAGDAFNPRIINGSTELDLIWHEVTDPKGVLLELSAEFIINHIKFELLSGDKGYSFSYSVAVSIDNSDWEMVTDHRSYSCRFWQYLYFTERVVRYIRLVGVSVGERTNDFCFRNLEAMFTRSTSENIEGIVAPRFNVANKKYCATFLADKKIYGKMSPYGENTFAFDCRSNGVLLVQLFQPYRINTIIANFFIVNNVHNVSIKTSIDNIDWVEAADKKDFPNGNQTFKFKPRNVMFIKFIFYNANFAEQLKIMKCCYE